MAETSPGRARGWWELRPLPLAVVLGLSGLAACGPVPAPAPSAAEGTPEASEVLRIHFLDVGQGDAVLIEAPGGPESPRTRRILVDAGPGDAVVAHLRRLEVDTLDLFIASHNHADHIGGAAAVLREFPVRFYMDNGIPHTTVTYRRTLEALREGDVSLLEPEGRTIEAGLASLEILPPPGDAALGHNDNSVGVVLRFGDFRASFAGDAEGRLWRHWLGTLPEGLPRVQVHKASHHGSRNGDLPGALELLRPALVVVSAGRKNPYGHPHPEALARYARVGARVLVTAQDGTIVVVAGADGEFRTVTEGVDEGAGWWTRRPGHLYDSVFGQLSEPSRRNPR